ncbi:hypothetical protein AVEN_115315-1 [Araneus ventricosus]|uniref:Uncharacterized protein n=1 Tax=Araneus ventricosus TaxID=182803 RepID=A0A4Y1ZZ95_ARAVE|nr:hypothetical protein AVEN_115315-1 [Araneus ventricosus]
MTGGDFAPLVFEGDFEFQHSSTWAISLNASAEYLQASSMGRIYFNGARAIFSKSAQNTESSMSRILHLLSEVTWTLQLSHMWPYIAIREQEV